MQFLGTKRTKISETVLNSLASQHHRPKIESSSSARINLLRIRENGSGFYDGQPRNFNCKVPQDVVTLRRRAARKGQFIDVARSSCQLHNEVKIPGDRKSSSNGLSNSSVLAWTASRKSIGYRKYGDGRCKSGRGHRSNDEDRGRQQPSRSTKANREAREDCYNNGNSAYDAILVLAGGQVVGGGVPVWVERRLDKALDLQQRSNNNGAVCTIVCLGGGTPHREPILSSQGFVIHESTSCAEYLHSRGAPFTHIIKEWASYDTIGNGYFSLTQHVIPRRWRTLAVVTSEFHMPRTRAAFEWIFGLQGAGLALHQQPGQLGALADVGPGTGSKTQGFHLEFHSVLDHGAIDESIVQARLERERNSMKNLNMLSQRIHNLEDFHQWFHTEHKAYNTKDQHLFGKEDHDDPALQSY